MIFRYALFSFALLIFSGCSSGPDLDTATPEGLYNQAEKYVKDERYEEAISQFQQVYNKHPYSRLATEARLRVGDIQYKREDYVEAQNSYSTFKELHPTHPKIAYATLQLALSIFHQLPETIDRDLSLSEKALLYLDEILTSYSGAPQAKEALDYKSRLIRMLGEKEMYVADYYFKREKYDSALGRYEDLLQKYSGVGLDAQALWGAVRSARQLKDATKEKHYHDILLSRHANSAEAKKAREEK